MAELASDVTLLPPEEPTTAVVSVPTREFASALAASAVVVRYDELEPAALTISRSIWQPCGAKAPKPNPVPGEERHGLGGVLARL